MAEGGIGLYEVRAQGSVMDSSSTPNTSWRHLGTLIYLDRNLGATSRGGARLENSTATAGLTVDSNKLEQG